SAPDVGRRYPGLVTAVSSTSAQLRIGSYRATLAPAAIAWTGRKTLSSVMKVGDLGPLVVKKRSDADKQLQADVPPWPTVEGALVALDPSTGEVRALVGGYDFDRSEFDRAVQARRQAGSAFKPLLFSA